MKIVSFLISTVFTIGFQSFTFCSASEFTLETIGTSSYRNILRSNCPNQSYFNNTFLSEIEKEQYLVKCPMIQKFCIEDRTAIYPGHSLVGLLPEECNAHLPKRVCQLPDGHIKIFLTVPLLPAIGTYAYSPQLATDPNATRSGYDSWRTGTVRLADSDTKTLFLQRIVRDCEAPEVFSIDPIPSGSIEISQAHNKAMILHDVGGKTVLSPVPIGIGGLQLDQSNSFWTCFEYMDNGQPQAIVGLHWMFNPEQRNEFSNTLERIRKRGTITQAIFLSEMQRLSNTDVFKNSGHVRKLMSLFNRQTFTLAKDGGSPFNLNQGFSGAEGTHRWTDGNKVVLEVPLHDSIDQKSRVLSFINTAGLVITDHPQEVIITLEDQVKRYTYTTNHPTHTIDLTIPDGLATARIEFDIPTAISPQGIGSGSDLRLLGIHFNDVELIHQYLAPSHTHYSLGTDEGHPFILEGFSGAEGSHRWTEGKKAKITIPLAGDKRPKMVSFYTDGLVTRTHDQNVTVSLNELESGKYRYLHQWAPNRTVNVSIPADINAATIEFDIPNAITPQKLGMGDDLRELGIAFSTVEFTY